MATNSQSDKFRAMFWPKVEDSSSAMQAMRLAQGAGLLIAFGYGLAMVLAFTADMYPDGTPIEDEAELYGLVFIYLVLIVLALLFWLLARKGMGWAVLIVCAWGLIEAVLKLLSGSGGGIVLALLLVLFCLGGIRGWLGLRKYGRPGERAPKPSIGE